MTTQQKLPWKRFFAEGMAIVISILLAFAIDAWWEDRSDQQAEQLLFQRLKADFTEIREAILFVESEHHETSVACMALISFPEGTAIPHTPEYDRMVALVFLTSRTFNPGSGSVAAFLNSEGARLVDNKPLADLLLSWSGLVEELQEEDHFLQEGLADRWIPFLKSRVSLGPYLAIYEEININIPAHIANPEPRTPLVVDADLVNNILDRYKFQQIALRDIKPIIEAIDQILILLDIELAEQ